MREEEVLAFAVPRGQARVGAMPCLTALKLKGHNLEPELPSSGDRYGPSQEEKWGQILAA